MKIRADVAQMLRAGHSDRQIARQLGVHRDQVIRARRLLGIPAGPTFPQPKAVEDLFRERVEEVDGGHLKWRGFRNERGTPVLKHRSRGALRNETAYRVAWRLQHDREPEGLVLPGCGYDQCVAPGHVEDRRLRNQVTAAYAAIFGETAA
ncbi:Homeodomain-like domain-containing protein [Streptomyces sp. Ag109_O5-1]|uniref:helix-turn-helix domain-containing protein n=1 Tax=Streptomyces sp. Ag109_O5-1 TaxID=1938851 RepID=UPI000F50639F|nr:helix-turn-helix domain-containing protein [Streptomyces sp. Ag109_O5-1]RPE40223.1 Homeodomain-like domain-containing protein [Streptomyces sp. Ag109_O5-1]